MRIARATELRAEGRRLSGTVIAYGDVSPSHRERFEPGAISIAETAWLDLGHDPMRTVAWHPGGGLRFEHDDRELRMSADVPPIPAGDRALRGVKDGTYGGLSIEFNAVQERREAGLRVIERADLVGVGLVAAPSYPASRVEARARSGRTLRSTIPADRSLQCECIAQGGNAGLCRNVVRLEREVIEPMAEMIRQAFEDAQAGRLGPDVVAVQGNYSSPIASARRGTLRAVAGDEGLDVEMDLPSGRVGDDVQAASEAAGVVARPLIDFDHDDTSYTDTPEGRVVTQAKLRAILVGATDSREGWPDARIRYDGEERSTPKRRNWRAWL